MSSGLSIYVHLPWCVRKCPYCDFNSHKAPDSVPEEQYIEALLADLKQDYLQYSETLEDRKVASVFLGGGTPSLFSADSVARLLGEISSITGSLDNAEITMEANPGTLESGPLRGYRQAGVNRLSLGVQSFQDSLLASIGRIHSGNHARRAVADARAAGFDNLNLDLMFGLPGQSQQQAQADLEEAIRLSPEHLSRYQLTIEPNTLFYAQPPRLPDPDTCWDMQQEGEDLLLQAGYERYEVSALSRAGRQCRHNMNYWTFGDYLGIGAGAHAKLTLDSSGREIVRLAKQRHPVIYMDSEHKVIERRRLEDNEKVFEFLLNGFRLKNGFSKALFKKRTGQTLDLSLKPWATALEIGLVEDTVQGVAPTDLGYRFLDDLVGLFLPEKDRQAHVAVQ